VLQDQSQLIRRQPSGSGGSLKDELISFGQWCASRERVSIRIRAAAAKSHPGAGDHLASRRVMKTIVMTC